MIEMNHSGFKEGDAEVYCEDCGTRLPKAITEETVCIRCQGENKDKK